MWIAQKRKVIYYRRETDQAEWHRFIDSVIIHFLPRGAANKICKRVWKPMELLCLTVCMKKKNIDVPTKY